MEMVLLLDIVRARREESTENSPSPWNERDRAADDWMRHHLPDPDEYSLEDSEEAGSTESYFFLRLRDSATVVYRVAVKDGKVSCGFAVVLKSDPASDQSFGCPT